MRYSSRLLILLFSMFVLLGISIGIKNFQFKTPTIPAESLANQEAERIARVCSDKQNRIGCYDNAFRKLTKEQTMDFAKQTLSALHKIDNQARDCHFIAHSISLVEAKKHPGDWQELLANQEPNICSSGYIHGILEAHMITDPSFRLDASQFPVICENASSDGLGKRSCFHHLGHLLLVEEGGNIQSSVSICNAIVIYEAKYECLSGVFMENNTRTVLPEHGLATPVNWDAGFAKEEEMLCDKQNSLANHVCWKELGRVYANLYYTNPSKVFSECNKGPRKETRKECYMYSLGNMLVKPDFNPENLAEICSFYNEDKNLFRECMVRAVNAMLVTSPEFSGWVTILCNNAPEWFQKDCFTEMDRGLKKNMVSWGKEPS